MFQQENRPSEKEELEAGIISPHTTRPHNIKGKKLESLAVKIKRKNERVYAQEQILPAFLLTSSIYTGHSPHLQADAQET